MISGEWNGGLGILTTPLQSISTCKWRPIGDCLPTRTQQRTSQCRNSRCALSSTSAVTRRHPDAYKSRKRQVLNIYRSFVPNRYRVSNDQYLVTLTPWYAIMWYNVSFYKSLHHHYCCYSLELLLQQIILPKFDGYLWKHFPGNFLSVFVKLLL